MRIRYLIFILLFITANQIIAQDLPLSSLKLPARYSISVYANGIPGARQLALGENGTVFVGTKGKNVYAITKSGQQTRVRTIATGLNQPNGVAFRKGALYIAEINRIVRLDNIETRLDNPPAPVVVRNNLPKDTWHGLRYISFGPDDKLYIGVGAPCNVCIPTDPVFATIMRMNADGTQYEIFAKGVRNTVGFDWDPETQKMWFTDNGRDQMGDNTPPDKLNYAPNKDMHFGFPYHHGKGIPDPEFGNRFPESNFTLPTLELPAHVAALGMKFYKGNVFPSLAGDEAKQIFIAMHGSWNRSAKVGYKIIRVWICGTNQVIWKEDFITGWLQNQTAWGRPVDVLGLKDGSLLISDDFANVVYQVSYK
ncbi:MAG: PQQ-dependent sugar dehydrogenase [Gammaproteobacteria bacterium]|nr:PQQ-dependent sugar dehydrogenase [Gammaproteobacteria bacterium]